jgi:flavin-dependent dehydrogenase
VDHAKSGVLIVGGGPAGLATAIALARHHIAAIVIERTVYADLRIGEHLSPSGVMKLRALDTGSRLRLEGHAPSAGVESCWGSATASHMDYFRHPAQRGVNLSRPRFDAELAGACESAGAKVLRGATLLEAHATASGWDAVVSHDGETRHFSVMLIVDASGRGATFARRQGARVRAEDRQIAVACLADRIDGDSDTRSTIETVEAGWWYSAPIGSERRIVMLVTDDDLLPKDEDRVDWWLRELGRTTWLPHGFGGDCRPKRLVLRSARSQRLNAMSGANWLAVGDAAMAFDPLSSQGIVKAFDHAQRAAASIAEYFAGNGRALQQLASEFEAEYAAYWATRASYYRMETRWRGSPFWQRRHAEAASARQPVPLAQGH